MSIPTTIPTTRAQVAAAKTGFYVRIRDDMPYFQVLGFQWISSKAQVRNFEVIIVDKNPRMVGDLLVQFGRALMKED